MRHQREFVWILSLAALGLMVSMTPQALADQQTSVSGQQIMIARFTDRPVVINGVLDPAEWSEAIPVHVQSNTPATAPGVVPNLPYLPFLVPPDNNDDSSFTIYAMYDNDNLYVAIDVADDFLFKDTPAYPWLDDDVEIFIDGDRQDGDLSIGTYCPPGSPCDLSMYGTCGKQEVAQNNEGFQLITSVGGVKYASPPNNQAISWESAVFPRPRGYLVEVKIPLDSINTLDTSCWTNGIPSRFRRPQPGDTIGFNVTVGDDDNGGFSYVAPPAGPRTNSYLAWDGSSLNWCLMCEPDWGSLYFAPRKR